MRRWYVGWSRVRDLLRGSRVDRDIDDELRFHIEEEVEAGVRRGLTPAQALRAAQESMGGAPLTIREDIRDTRRVDRVDDFRRDVRHAVRLLRRNPAFTTAIAGTLALAIGATVTAFSITDAWLFRPLRFPDADRLAVAFVATADRPGEPALFMPYRAYLAFKESARTFSSICAAFFQNVTWRTSSDARSLTGMRVTPEFFATFGVSPLRGRPLGAADGGGTPGIVISYGFWQRELGGAETALGSTVTLSDVVYTVIGIMPADFDVRLLDQPEGAAFWTLIRTGERGYVPGGMGPVAIVGRLNQGLSIEAAKSELAGIMRRTESAYSENFNQPGMANGAPTAFLVNLSSLQADNTRTVRATLVTVLAAALCLLLIAAMNVGVLLLGRGLGRRNEVALRHALGAGRGRLMRQFLSESLVLSACGAVGGIAVAVLGTRLFVVWNPLDRLPFTGVALDARALSAAMVAMLLTTVIAGLVPAIRLSTESGASLRGGERGRTTAPAHRAQRAMLVAQMAVSTVLLVCAALLARTFIQLRTEPLGFSSNGVTVAEVVLPTSPFDSSAARNAFYDQMEKQLLGRPGVRGVAASTSPPLTSGPPAVINVTAVDEPTAPRLSTQDVTTGFFETLDISLIAGRTFDRRDTPQGLPVVVLNWDAATTLFGYARRAVGQRVRLEGDTWREVVGVVGTVRTTFFNTLEWRLAPIVYRPAAQALSRMPPAATSFTLWIHVRSDRLLAAPDVRDAARAVGSRAAVIQVRQVPEMVAAATQQPTFRMALLLGLCVASLVLAAIGVYGVVTQAVTERVREMAIRLALGAQPRELAVSFVRNALTAGSIGLAIGVAASMMLARTLESVLYGVRTADAASLAVAAILLLAVIAVAAWLPATRATRVDAVIVLRA
jgi:putative ABC transport system permease protein